MHVDNSRETLSFLCEFGTINFPFFLPYSFPVLHVIELYVEAHV
jgi:hypothetical protein